MPVNDVSLDVRRGEIVGLVGESSSGKSMTALSILGLLPPEAEVVAGNVVFDGRDLASLEPKAVDRLRGAELAVVFQDPMTFLNPVARIQDQIAEPIVLHERIGKREARVRAEELLASVGIGDVRRVARSYPHLLSGGMRQRVLLAIALACRPKLLIADEPFTAVDVSVQDQLISLIRDKQRELQFSVLLITHDLTVAAELCDRLFVMYAGQIVESGDIFEIFEHPKHPYTKALIESAQFGGDSATEIRFIPGTVPSLMDPPSGCRFHPRCAYALAICDVEAPPATETSSGHVRCWLNS